MNVKLVALTKSFINEKELSPEDLIVYIARVSNPNNQLNIETSDRLLNYLIKNKHWSPLEHVSFTVEIKTSRAIAAQILRHRSFVFQEFSQRYSEISNFEDVQLRYQADKNRQSSTDLVQDASLNQDIKNLLAHSQKLYSKLISQGVAKECARMILPLTTETTIYMTGSVRSWLHYLELRCDEHTQLEHRDIANAIKNDIFVKNFPNISKALGWDLEAMRSVG